MIMKEKVKSLLFEGLKYYFSIELITYYLGMMKIICYLI